MNTNLNNFLQNSFGLFTRAAADKKSPMRLPVLGTTAANDLKLRTIVLRKFEKAKNELIFFTDIRSEKIVFLRQNPLGVALFYHPKKQIQIQVKGHISIHYKNKLAAEFWKNLTVFGRKSYATLLSPSTKLEEESDNLDAEIWYKTDPPTIKDTDQYFENFAVLTLKFNEMEILSLARTGHRRAVFKYLEEKSWTGTWIVP